MAAASTEQVSSFELVRLSASLRLYLFDQKREIQTILQGRVGAKMEGGGKVSGIQLSRQRQGGAAPDAERRRRRPRPTHGPNSGDAGGVEGQAPTFRRLQTRARPFPVLIFAVTAPALAAVHPHTVLTFTVDATEA